MSSYNKLSRVTDKQGNTQWAFDKNLYEEFGLNPYGYQAGSSYNPYLSMSLNGGGVGYGGGGGGNSNPYRVPGGGASYVGRNTSPFSFQSMAANALTPQQYGQNALLMEYMSDPNKASKDMMSFLDKRWARLMGRGSGAVSPEQFGQGRTGAGGVGSNAPYDPQKRTWW